MSAMPQPGGERWCYRDRKLQGGKLPAFLQGLSAPPGAAGRGPPARTTRRRVAWATVASSHHSRYAGAASGAPRAALQDSSLPGVSFLPSWEPDG